MTSHRSTPLLDEAEPHIKAIANTLWPTNIPFKKELEQEARAAIWIEAPDLPSEIGKRRSALCRFIRNRMIDHIRAVYGRDEVLRESRSGITVPSSLDAMRDTGFDVPHDFTPEKALEIGQMMAMVDEAAATLPAREQRAYEAMVWEDTTNRAAAEAGVTPDRFCQIKALVSAFLRRRFRA